MSKVLIGNVKGNTGDSGSIWYNGTGITGTNTTPAVYSGSGVTAARVGDYYINFADSDRVYICSTAGDASTAKWYYVGTLKGSTVPATEYDVTIPSSGWTASGNGYTNTVTVSGITSNTVIGVVNLASSQIGTVAAEIDYGKIHTVNTGAGTVTFTSFDYSDAFTTDLSVVMWEM